MDKTTLPANQNLERLPSLPQILLKILDAVANDTADFQQLAQIIQQDSAITARILNVANSSLYRRNNSCETLDRALTYLGLETVKTLVITAAVKQYFGQFNLDHHTFIKHFWLRSLTSAHCAQLIANLTSYHSPAEAYLCGLLVDLGQLWLLTEHESRYLSVLSASKNDDDSLLENEIISLNITHSDAGADLIDNWQLDSFMADAVRYHHHSVNDIQQSHHLVKIINLASELSLHSELSEKSLEKANILFGFNEDLIIEFRHRINKDVKDIAASIGINVEIENDLRAQSQLGEKLSEISLRTSLQSSLTQEDQNSFNQNIQRTLYLVLGIERFIIFTHDIEHQLLKAYLSKEITQPDFVIDSRLNDCAVNRAFNQKVDINTKNYTFDTISIIDRQLLKYCRMPYLISIPFSIDGNDGVFVAGANASILDQHQKKPSLWKNLILDISKNWLSKNNQNAEHLDDKSSILIRETIHEANNPLSIINNYLEMLSIKLGNEAETQRDIKIIKEEIDRVGKIILRLKDPQTNRTNELIDINRTIEDLVAIFKRSLCTTRNIAINLSLDTLLNPVHLDKTSFKQILTNIIKNAIEAMPSGGILDIKTQHRVIINGSHYFAINIEDNGPGIPEHIMAKLFKPVSSTKGISHSGIGLSVVKKLMDEMHAQIVCSSDKNGSQFKLLFPLAI